MVSVLAEDEVKRDKIRAKLSGVGGETRPLFPPAHQMPMYLSNQSFPIAENISQRGLNLPSFHTLTHEQISFICDHIKTVL